DRLRHWRRRAARPLLRAGARGSEPDGQVGNHHRQLRPDRGQRGIRGAGARRRPRAGLGLGPGQHPRWGGGPGPPDRRERRPGPHDAALRSARPRRLDRPGDPLPRRRQRRGAQRGAGLMGASREVAVVASSSRSSIGRRLVEIGVGALAVALAAQAAVPVPFSPVPMTLQPLAVLAVGGLLGATGGVAALTTYLALGIFGLPVFAGGSAGAVHLVGPTGGYLLAFPLAAGAVGALTGRSTSVLRILLACVAGMVIIHAGGV